MKIFAIVFLHIFILISCKKDVEEIKKTIIFNDFDMLTLNPNMKSNIKSNWTGKAYFINNSLKKITFYNNSQKVIKEDTVLYINNMKYLINSSNFIKNKVDFKIFKVTFIKNKKIQRHFLIKRSNKFYLSCVDVEKELNIFERRRINIRSYTMEFKSINEYLLNLKTSIDNKFYFVDYYTYEIFYKNKGMILKRTLHDVFLGGTEFDTIKQNENYNNLYLDLDKNDKLNFIID